MFSKPPPTTASIGMELKKVGWFKGLITIYNPPDLFAYNSNRLRLYNQLSQMINKMYKVVIKKRPDDPNIIPLDFELNTILTKERADKFRKILTFIDTYSDDLVEFFKEISYQEMLNSSLSKIKQNFVRVYVLNGLEFANKDLFGNSDPFIIVKCGKKSFSTKENYQEDEPNPEFYQMFDFAM